MTNTPRLDLKAPFAYIPHGMKREQRSRRQGESSIKLWLKGPKAHIRSDNWHKLAEELHRGNFSAFVAEAITAYYRLDPETGKRRRKR